MGKWNFNCFSQQLVYVLDQSIQFGVWRFGLGMTDGTNLNPQTLNSKTNQWAHLLIAVR